MDFVLWSFLKNIVYAPRSIAELKKKIEDAFRMIDNDGIPKLAKKCFFVSGE